MQTHQIPQLFSKPTPQLLINPYPKTKNIPNILILYLLCMTLPPKINSLTQSVQALKDQFK